MKIMLAIMMAFVLTSCRVEKVSTEPVLYGNKSPYPQILTAKLVLDDEKYSCTSFDGSRDSLIFMCTKVKDEKVNSSSTSTK
jgi:hypothetical protein